VAKAPRVPNIRESKDCGVDRHDIDGDVFYDPTADVRVLSRCLSKSALAKVLTEQHHFGHRRNVDNHIDVLGWPRSGRGGIGYEELVNHAPDEDHALSEVSKIPRNRQNRGGEFHGASRRDTSAIAS
jgi:hypothetical protein